MSEIRIQVTDSGADFLDRFGRELPEAVRAGVEGQFRILVGRLEDLVIQNIEEMFTEQGRSTGKLAESILSTVTREGDLIVGEVSADLSHAPYARILELGGVTSAHQIRPVHAGALKIPINTLSGFEAGEVEEQTQEYIFSFGVDHPGSRFTARYYLRGALATLSREVGDSIETAIQDAIARTNLRKS